jgi:hypothetical protein
VDRRPPQSPLSVGRVQRLSDGACAHADAPMSAGRPANKVAAKAMVHATRRPTDARMTPPPE